MSDLARLAILGTGQVADAAADLSGTPADALVARLDRLERERAFLLRAGGAAVLQRAARKLERAALPDDAAPQERARPAGTRVSALLASMLDGNDAELLPEALQLLARAGLRLPFELLPAALSAQSDAQRAALLPVLGERGRWLARKQPEWSWAHAQLAEELPADAEQRWQQGSAAERVPLLATARRTQRALARAWIERGWKQEKAEQRLAWLEQVGETLGPDDVELLTPLLGDRSAQVRSAVARMLWCLPQSELAQRMQERLAALVGFEPARSGLLAKLKSAVGAKSSGTLKVSLPPETFDPSWERDGIIEAAPQGSGRRQWWLAQALSAVPPDRLAERCGLSPADVVALAQAHEQALALLDGLTGAALRFEARAWYAPLWDARLAATFAASFVPRPLEALTRALSAEEAEPRMLELLAAGRSDLLLLRPWPWPASLGRAFLARVAKHDRSLTGLLPAASLALPAELLPESVSLPELSDDADYAARAYLRALDRFATLTALRRTLHREIVP